MRCTTLLQRNFIPQNPVMWIMKDVPGQASLWLSTLAEKCEAGEIIYDLRIKENHAADEHKAGLTFFFL